MCFDPITLGLVAAGTGASMIGNSMQQSDATKAMVAEKNAKNAALKKYLDKAAVYSKEAAGISEGATAQFAPEAQTAMAEGANTARTDRVIGNMTPMSVAMPATGSTNGTSLIQDAVNKKYGETYTRKTDTAKKRAAFDSYGDVWADNSMNLLDPARKMKTVNRLSADAADLLGAQQDTAAYMAYKPSSGLGSALSTVGGLLGGLAGSGLLKGSGGSSSLSKGTLGGTGIAGIGGFY
jgi:hypothetical protein